MFCLPSPGSPAPLAPGQCLSRDAGSELKNAECIALGEVPCVLLCLSMWNHCSTESAEHYLRRCGFGYLNWNTNNFLYVWGFFCKLGWQCPCTERKCGLKEKKKEKEGGTLTVCGISAGTAPSTWMAKCNLKAIYIRKISANKSKQCSYLQ